MSLRKAACRFGLAAPLVIGLALLFAGQRNVRANQQEKPAAGAEVKIDNFSFGPQTLTIAAGTTVAGTNRDDIPHTAVSTDGAFKSKGFGNDEKFLFTFMQAGAYPH